MKFLSKFSFYIFCVFIFQNIFLYGENGVYNIKEEKVNILEILKEYDINYSYDNTIKKLVIKNGNYKADFTDNIDFYKTGVTVKKLDFKTISSSDGFFIDINAFKDISKNIFSNDTVINYSDKTLKIATQKKDIAKGIESFTPVINEARNYIIDTVIIDAGHGGKDPGSIGDNSLYEKDITLKIALALEKELKAKLPKINIELTRTNDVFYTLQKRSEIANTHAKLNTDKPRNAIFISVHCNASFNKLAKGFEIYFLSADESSEYARAVSRFENSVAIEFEKVDSSKYTNYSQTSYYYMLIEQYQKESRMLSEFIADTVHKIGGVNKRPQPIQSALFYVLKGSVMPAVLLEVGFITNPEDAKLLKSESFQKDVAKSVTFAVEKYIKDFERTKGFSQ